MKKVTEPRDFRGSRWSAGVAVCAVVPASAVLADVGVACAEAAPEGIGLFDAVIKPDAETLFDECRVDAGSLVDSEGPEIACGDYVAFGAGLDRDAASGRNGGDAGADVEDLSLIRSAHGDAAVLQLAVFIEKGYHAPVRVAFQVGAEMTEPFLVVGDRIGVVDQDGVVAPDDPVGPYGSGEPAEAFDDFSLSRHLRFDVLRVEAYGPLDVVGDSHFIEDVQVLQEVVAGILRPENDAGDVFGPEGDSGSCPAL